MMAVEVSCPYHLVVVILADVACILADEVPQLDLIFGVVAVVVYVEDGDSPVCPVELDCCDVVGVRDVHDFPVFCFEFPVYPDK